MFIFDYKARKITFGGYPDESLDINWHRMTTPYFWSLQLEAVTLGNKTVSLKSHMAVVDSGTSYLVVPQYEFDQILNYFRGEMMCARNSQNLY